MRTGHYRQARRIRRAIAICILWLALAAPSSHAGEVRVFAAGAVQKAVAVLVPVFEDRTGHKVIAVYDTVGALRDRVLAGENPDLILLSSTALGILTEKGRVIAGTIRPFGRTGVGLMAPLAAASVDIATTDAFKAALLAARRIVHADPARGATAGTHFRKVITDLGIAAQLAPRITVVPFGGDIARQVADGQFDIGVSQASEIVADPRVRFLGFLPSSLQLWTVYAVAAVSPGSDASIAFGDLLLSPAGLDAFQRIGFVR